MILAKGGKVRFDLPHRINRDGPVQVPTPVPVGQNDPEELSLDELEVRER